MNALPKNERSEHTERLRDVTQRLMNRRKTRASGSITSGAAKTHGTTRGTFTTNESDSSGNYVPLADRGKTYQCLRCEDRGLISPAVPVDHPQFGTAIVCPDCQGGPALAANRAKKRQRVLDLMREAGLTATTRHDHLGWENFDVEAMGFALEGKDLAIDLARRWAAGDRLSYDMFDVDHPFARRETTYFRAAATASLLLYGDVGVGKTGLAYVAYRTFTQRTGVPGVFVEWGALYEAIRSQYGKSGDENQSYPLLDAVATAPVLFLDDIGHVRRQRAVSEDQYEKLWLIIDHRYRHPELPTLLTSNLDRHALRDLFDSKLAGRVAEMCVMCEMGGVNLRERDQG